MIFSRSAFVSCSLSYVLDHVSRKLCQVYDGNGRDKQSSDARFLYVNGKALIKEERNSLQYTTLY